MPITPRKFSRHSGGANKDYLETIVQYTINQKDPSSPYALAQILKQEFPVDIAVTVPGDGETFEQVNGGIYLNPDFYNNDVTNLYFEDITTEFIESLDLTNRLGLFLTPRYKISLSQNPPTAAYSSGSGQRYWPSLVEAGAANSNQIYDMLNTPPFLNSNNVFTGDFLYSLYNTAEEDFVERGDPNFEFPTYTLWFTCRYYTCHAPVVSVDTAFGDTVLRDKFPNANNF